VLETETAQRLAKGSGVNGLNDLSVYFKEMKKITEDKKIPSRVRFLMQDVLDLRLSGWKARREVAGPKTIDQIHADIKKEQLNAKLQAVSPSGPMSSRRVRGSMFSLHPPSPSSTECRGGRDDRDRGRDGDQDRGSKKGPDQGETEGDWTEIELCHLPPAGEQPVGLKVRVWGPLASRDDVLQRVDALKHAIKATKPIFLEPEVLVEEVDRFACTLQAVLLSQHSREALGQALNKLLHRPDGLPRVKAKWSDPRPEEIMNIV
jgi:hypothetical protein